MPTYRNCVVFFCYVLYYKGFRIILYLVTNTAALIWCWLIVSDKIISHNAHGGITMNCVEFTRIPNLHMIRVEHKLGLSCAS